MNFSVERSVLLRALSHVQSVVERRTTIPILSNLLMEADEGQLALTATDMDVTIVETVEADVAQAGALTLPAHTLYDIARKLPDGTSVQFDAQPNGKVNVTSGRSEFALATLPREDFPRVNVDDLPTEFGLPASQLRQVIDRTRFAISTEETRYYLNGIYLHCVAPETASDLAMMRAVATDGHRLAKVEFPAPERAEEMPGIIIPRKTVQELRKLIDDLDDNVLIGLSETKICFKFGVTELTSKLIDGTFPEYQRVIPSGNSRHMSVDAKAFAESVDRVSIISTEKSRAIKLALSDSRVTLTANSPDAGTASDELEVVYSGEPIEIGFNARYLMDIAAQIGSGEMSLSMGDSASPTLIEASEDSASLYVLMPMRV